MDPQSGSELPHVSNPELSHSPEASGSGLGLAPESLDEFPAERHPGQSGAGAPSAGTASGKPQLPDPFAAQPTQTIPPISTPPVADDLDLIEKEWVEKAKEIIARNQQDPYVQNKEVNVMKADYLKKRYDKDIKIEDR